MGCCHHSSESHKTQMRIVQVLSFQYKYYCCVTLRSSYSQVTLKSLSLKSSLGLLSSHSLKSHFQRDSSFMWQNCENIDMMICTYLPICFRNLWHKTTYFSRFKNGSQINVVFPSKIAVDLKWLSHNPTHPHTHTHTQKVKPNSSWNMCLPHSRTKTTKPKTAYITKNTKCHKSWRYTFAIGTTENHQHKGSQFLFPTIQTSIKLRGASQKTGVEVSTKFRRNFDP